MIIQGPTNPLPAAVAHQARRLADDACGAGVNPSDPATVDLPSYSRIRDGLTTSRLMGSRVVRAHTVGVNLGSPNSLEPTLGHFNKEVFASADYAVAESGRLGLKLLVPLTDNWDYYHGGKYTFLRWLGVSTADNGAAFFTDPTVRAAFKEYIAAVLTHVNLYTGKRYVDDPTVMAWELGNELNGMTPEWINDISSAGLRMWLQADGSAHDLTVQFVTSTGYWEASISPTGTGAQLITIPFTQFKPPSWAPQDATLDLTSVSQISFYLGGSTGSGTLRVDSVTAYLAP